MRVLDCNAERNPVPSEVVITRSTSELAAKRVLQAAREAGPFSPVPPEATCLLERPFNPFGISIDGN